MHGRNHSMPLLTSTILPANLGIPLTGDHHSILCLHHHMVIFILSSPFVHHPYSRCPHLQGHVTLGLAVTSSRTSS